MAVSSTFFVFQVEGHVVLVEAEWSGGDFHRSGSGLEPSHEGMDAEDEFLGRKRLCEVIVGSSLKALDAILGLGARAESMITGVCAGAGRRAGAP